MRIIASAFLALSAVGTNALVQPMSRVGRTTALQGFRQDYMESANNRQHAIGEGGNFVERGNMNGRPNQGMYDRLEYNERRGGGYDNPRNEPGRYGRADRYGRGDMRSNGEYTDNRSGTEINNKYERYNPNRHTKEGIQNFVEHGRDPSYNDRDFRFDVPRDGFDGGHLGDLRPNEFVGRNNGNALQRYNPNGQDRRERGDNRGPSGRDRFQDGRRPQSDNRVWGESRNGPQNNGGGYLVSDNDMRDRGMLPENGETGFGWQNSNGRPRPSRGAGGGYDLHSDNWWEGNKSKGDRRTKVGMGSYERAAPQGEHRPALQRYNGRVEGQNPEMGGRRFEDPYRPGDRNLMGEDYHSGPRYLSGGKLERFSFDPSVSNVLVELWSEGLPIQASIEVLQESGKPRQSFPVNVEDGYTRPYSTVLDLSGNSGCTVLIRNDGPIEYPITAHVQPQGQGGPNGMPPRGSDMNRMEGMDHRKMPRMDTMGGMDNRNMQGQRSMLGMDQHPMQGQRNMQGMDQRPMQGQRNMQGMDQRPMQGQRNMQGMDQRPMQGMNQRPMQGPMQGMDQRNMGSNMNNPVRPNPGGSMSNPNMGKSRNMGGGGW